VKDFGTEELVGYRGVLGDCGFVQTRVGRDHDLVGDFSQWFEQRPD
jgi:hypothetical protein